MTLFREVWQSNAHRCGGRFNLYFIWLYPWVFIACGTYDALSWFEKKLTPIADSDDEP